MKFVLVIVILFQLAACGTTPRYVDVPKPGQAPPSDQVMEGASVRVQKLDGETFEFEVLEVTPEGIRSTEGMVRYSDMESLAVMRPAPGGGWVVVGILAGVAILFGLSGAAATGLLDAGSGG